MKTIPLSAWVLSVLAAVLQLLPFPIAGPVPSWRRALCWFCIIPLLLALRSRDRTGRRINVVQAATLAYLCGILWYSGNCYWIYQTMYTYGAIPELPSAGILILFALYLGLYHALFGGILAFLSPRYNDTLVALLVPFLWVAVELARARITGFPWDLLGYAQVDNQLLTRLAPVGGVMLLSFIIASVNAFVFSAITRPKRKHRWVFLGLAACTAVLFQLGCLYAPPADSARHVAALLQENLSVGAEGRDLVPYPINAKYKDFSYLSLHPMASDISSQRHAELVIWPEAPADFLTSDPVFRAHLADLARAADAPVIVGSVGIDFDPGSPRGYHEYGSAAVFRADGTYLGRYDKIHRVPWGEYVPYSRFFSFAGKLVSGVGNMEAGSGYKVFQLNGHTDGIFICYESIFGDEVRRFVENGAQVLVNISDDGWYGDSGAPWQHLDMARMRAIENNRWVLRDTNTGITTSIDPHGRGDFLEPRHERVAFALPFDYCSGTTFYTRHGDWFAWVCVLVIVALMLLPFGRHSSPQ